MTNPTKTASFIIYKMIRDLKEAQSNLYKGNYYSAYKLFMDVSDHAFDQACEQATKSPKAKKELKILVAEDFEGNKHIIDV